MKFKILFICVLCIATTHAQKVGIQTLAPDAPLHIWNSGQVNTPGGMLLLGNRSEGHMEMDFNQLQCLYGLNSLDLRIQPDGGNVGINTPFPTLIEYPLQVDGEMGISSYIRHNGDDDTNFRFTADAVQIQTGGQTNLLIQPSKVVLGQIFDLYVDAVNHEVGIGTNTPDYKLDVAGDIGINGDLTHNGDSNTELRFNTDQVMLVAGGKTLFSAFGDISNQVLLGDGSDVDLNLNGHLHIDGGDGQVGIGEDSPNSKLHINSDVGENPFRVQRNGSTKMIIHDNGNVGVSNSGSFTPVTTLHVRHNNGAIGSRGLSIENTSSKRWHFYINSNNNMVLYGDNALHGTFLWGLGDYVPFSDFRMKRDIQELPSVLAGVLQLTPSSYKMLTEDDSVTPQFGFIAQQVLELFPENVRHLDSEDRYVVLYKGMSTLAIKAIQEQQMLIDSLEKENEVLLERLERLEKAVFN